MGVGPVELGVDGAEVVVDHPELMIGLAELAAHHHELAIGLAELAIDQVQPRRQRGRTAAP